MKNGNNEYSDFIQAASATYAWMCASDARVTLNEGEGFFKHLDSQPYLDMGSFKEFETSYSEIFNKFQSNFDEAPQETVKRIEALKYNRKYSEELVRIARKALAIDGRLEEVEENVLNDICTILDIDESALV